MKNLRFSWVTEDYVLYEDGSLYSHLSKRFLKPYTGKNGYPYYTMGKVREYVHRMMLYHFVRPPKEGEEADHINHDRLDYSLENLRWVTRSENISHSYSRESRLRPVSYRHPNCKLSDEEVAEIYTSKDSERSLARIYGVSPRTIGHIRRGERYQWVTKELV